MKKTGKLALGGVLSALSVVLMMLTGLSVGVYALPMLAGMVLIPMAIECGTRWGMGIYAVAALLTGLLAPSVEGRLLFILFFGYYPALKNSLDCLRPVWLRWLLKYALFNAAMVGTYLLLFFVFGLDADTFSLLGVSLPWVFLLAGNAVFLLYDYTLTLCGGLYIRRLQPFLRRLFRY